MAPFVRDGAEQLAGHLCARLNVTRGVNAEVLRVPFSRERFERLADEIFLNRTLKLPNVDRVIALKFPAYIIPHHTKVLWLSNRCRQAYELPDRRESNIPESPRGEKIRELICRSDTEAFSKSRRIFSSSKVTQEWLNRYKGFDSEVLMPPLNNPELFSNCGDGGYIFAGGNVNLEMRQHLLVEAMGLTKSAAKLIVAGSPETLGDADRLRSAVKRLKLEDRVVLDFGFHPVAKIADYVNRARACAYLPVDEDSVGHVTMEAASASKPVITLTDSGGILQVVLNGETGCVAEPDAKAIAGAIDSIYSDPTRSEQMGRAARTLWDSFEVTWPKTIERLLS
jgi:glycosyltransferase involved in cell wall biosynthesis